MFSSALGSFQHILVLVLSLLALGMEVFSLVDAVRQRPDAFVAAGKQTKKLWLIILGVATALGVITLPIASGFGSLGLLSIIAVIAAGVYLADVRPALRNLSGGSGPYGRW